MLSQNFTKLKKQHEIVFNSFSRNMGPGNEWGPRNEPGARRAEQFPHLGNYTLTPD